MKSQIVSLLLCAGLGSLGSVPAQTGALPQTPTAAANPDYRIAAGDVLSISVVDFPNLSVPQTVVAPDGTVSLSLIHQVNIAGQTVGQTTALLVTKYKKYIIDPSITVSLMQKHPQTIVFSGSVIRPGVLEYRPQMHLIESLAEAGGAISTANAGNGATPIADPTHVIVTHEDGTKQTLDLTHPELLAGTPTDIALEPGDVIYVPEQIGKISVVGQVRQPGVIPYRENLTIFDAISDSGGFNADTADLPNASLVHNGVTSPLNLDPMLRHGDMAANIVMAPGDQISIPELKNRTFVFGDVARPGYYLYKPGDRIQDALSGVSGPTGQADLGKINVIRTDKIHGTQMVRVNFNDFVLHGNMSGNPLIQPGDSLYIPDKKHPLSLSDVFGALSGVGQAAYGASVLGGK
jgi:polysaccharide export outer membrane protein